MFLAATLLASGMYSNQIFAPLTLDLNHDGKINLHEAEINADIEQENKCKKDTECENENEINNLLNITTITKGAGAANGNGNGNGNGQSPDEEHCLFCLSTDDGSPFDHPGGEGQLNQLREYLEDQNNIVPIAFEPDVNSIEQLCAVIVEASATTTPVTSEEIANLLIAAIDPDDLGLINDVIECLGDLIEVIT